MDSSGRASQLPRVYARADADERAKEARGDDERRPRVRETHRGERGRADEADRAHGARPSRKTTAAECGREDGDAADDRADQGRDDAEAHEHERLEPAPAEHVKKIQREEREGDPEENEGDSRDTA